MPVTRTEVGRNVFLQVRRDVPFALSRMAEQLGLEAGALAGLGSLGGVAACRQSILWQPAADMPARRVLVPAVVCLDRGYLEHLLTRKGANKEHESVLTADIDARHLHAALLATGARPGRPVQFVNQNQELEFKPAAGDRIKVSLQYDVNGKTVTVPAQQWVRDVKTKKDLAQDWVFAGSQFFKDPEGLRPDFYGANEGRIICTSNFTTALLDLPIASTDRNDDLQFEVNTDRVPPLGTKVWVILEPVKP